MSTPAPPRGATAPGRMLWVGILDAYELEDHELALLVEIVRTMALLDRLDEVVRADGPITYTKDGAPRAHPAAVEARQQRLALARLQGALRLPSGEEADGNRRPQRRTGVRVPYRFTGTV